MDEVLEELPILELHLRLSSRSFCGGLMRGEPPLSRLPLPFGRRR